MRRFLIVFIAVAVLVGLIGGWKVMAINTKYERNLREHPPEKLCPYCGVR